MKNVFINKLVKVSNYSFVLISTGLIFLSIGVIVNLVLTGIFK